MALKYLQINYRDLTSLQLIRNVYWKLIDSNLPFLSNVIFSCILLLFLYGLHSFQNGLELQSTESFAKYCYLVYLFRFATKFRCRLNLTMSLGLFDLFALFLRRDLVIIACEGSYQNGGFDSLLKCCFLGSIFIKNVNKIIFKDCMGSPI